MYHQIEEEAILFKYINKCLESKFTVCHVQENTSQ